jgi:hypothetical protein
VLQLAAMQHTRSIGHHLLKLVMSLRAVVATIQPVSDPDRDRPALQVTEAGGCTKVPILDHLIGWIEFSLMSIESLPTKKAEPQAPLKISNGLRHLPVAGSQAPLVQSHWAGFFAWAGSTVSVTTAGVTSIASPAPLAWDAKAVSCAWA